MPDRSKKLIIRLLLAIGVPILLVAACTLSWSVTRSRQQAELQAVLRQLDYTPAAELRRGQGCWNGVVYFDGDCAIYTFYTTDLTLDEFSQMVEQVGSERLPRAPLDRDELLFLNTYRPPALTINGTLIRSSLQPPPVELPDAYLWRRTYNGHWLSVEFYEVANSPHNIAWNGTRIRDNVARVQFYTNK